MVSNTTVQPKYSVTTCNKQILGDHKDRYVLLDINQQHKVTKWALVK